MSWKNDERLVLEERLELAKLLQVGDPAGADLVGDQLGEGRIGLEEPTARRDAVSHVVEVVGHQLVEVLEERRLEDLGVELGDAVHAGGADDREVRHAHGTFAALVD